MTNPSAEPDARLLRALYAQYLDDRFDEINLSIDAVRRPDLMAALTFLDPKINRRGRALARCSISAVKDWLDRVEGRPVDGFQLHRDRIGWFHVERIGA